LNSSGAVTATNTFGGGGLVSRSAGSTSVFYSFDSEGNITHRSDSSGTVLSNHVFSVHGSMLSGTLSQPFGYKAQLGYYTDNETGLQLLTNRYYDRSIGRFLTRDPVSYSGGLNLYSYVQNNVTNYIDPIGFERLNYVMKPPPSNPDGGFVIVAHAAQISAGFGDTITFGGTKLVRSFTPGGVTVDARSSSYFAGEVCGIWQLFFDLEMIPRAVPEMGPRPPADYPTPPGWGDGWEWRYPEGGSSRPGPRWFDPNGGEWRWHPEDKWHPDGHWDHNPWDQWNSEWRNVPN
jgi:RHS repeat-associated protein